MRKIAAITTALIILIPVGALLPFLGHSSDVPATNLFSRTYANYTLSLGAPPTSTGQGSFKFIISDYSVKFPTGLVKVFDDVGLERFANDGRLDETETFRAYTGSDVDFTLHSIPTAAMAFEFKGDNSVYFILSNGMSALASDGGMVVGDGKASATVLVVGAGSLENVGGGILASGSAGSRVIFRANPGSDSFVAQRVANGAIASEMFTTSSGDKLLDDNIAFSQVEMGTVVTTNDTYSASLAGALATGKVVIINVDRSILPDLNTRKMTVKLDDEKVSASDSLASILWETGADAKYFVASDGDWLQVYVYVPQLTADQTITLEPQGPLFGADEIASALAAVVLVSVAAVALYRRD